MNIPKVALVTGGSRGLGSEIVLDLSASGYRVAFNYLNSGDEAAAVLSRSLGPDTIMIKADVSSSVGAGFIARTVSRAWGRLDILVNNAGVSRDALIARTSEEDWESHMSVNLGGAFQMTRQLSGLMAASGGGHIINISSRSGLRGKAGQAAYSASKAALIGFSLSSARELAHDCIRVNAVLPGYMPTDMGLAAPGGMEKARLESLTGTLGKASDLASFIKWLSSTSSVTGQVFSIDSRIG